MRRNEGVGNQYLFRCYGLPLGGFRNHEQWSTVALQARHLMRVTQPTILPRLVVVPVHEHERQAE